MVVVGIEAAFYVTGLLVILSGGVGLVWMEETRPEFGTHEPPAAVTGAVTSDSNRTVNSVHGVGIA